jgi:hypothetical protein
VIAGDPGKRIGMAKLHDIEIDDYFAECIRLDDNSLSEEFMRVANDRYYWSVKLNDAVEDQRRAELALKMARASVSQEMRAKAKLANEKLTEGTIDELTTLHPDVVAAAEAEITADVRRMDMLERVRAIDKKGEAAISLGAQKRKEMESDPSMRAFHDKNWARRQD